MCKRVVLLFLASLIAIISTPRAWFGAETAPEPSMKIDAFEAGSWNGIVFITDDSSSFEIRVGAQAEFGDFIDGDNRDDLLSENFRKSLGGKRPGQWAQHLRTAPLYHAVREVGAHAPDGSYSRVSWNPLHPYDTGSRIRLEWTQLDNKTVLGKVTYSAPFGQIDYNAGTRSADIVVEAYSPWNEKRGMVEARYSTVDGAIFGTTNYRPPLGVREWDRWQFYFSSDQPDTPPETETGRLQRFFDAGLDDSNWKVVRWGTYWQEEPGIKSGGYAWYRHRLVLPENWKGEAILLDLGKIAEDDWTFLNGKLVGSWHDKNDKRNYTIEPGDPAYEGLLWGKENLLAIQVRSKGVLGGVSSGQLSSWGRVDPPPRPTVRALGAGIRKLGFAVVTDKVAKSSGTYDKLVDLQRQIVEKGELNTQGGSHYAALHIAGLHEESKKLPQDNTLYFLAAVGEADLKLIATARQRLSQLHADEVLTQRQAAYEAKRVRTTGEFAEAAEMTANTAHWSVLYGPEQRRFFIVDSRRWCVPNLWFLAGNSAVMSAWAGALESQQLAQNTLVGILDEQLPNGMVPNMGGSWFSTPNRSQDMYAAYSAWKIYTKYRDRAFLREVYPRIKAWHEWWFADRGDGQPRRDGNRDGLLEIGTDAVAPGTPQDPPDSETYGNNAQAAYWESFDDSPMYSNAQKGPAVHPERYGREPHVRFVYKTSTLNLDLVHVNALYALSADCLARIADELGHHDESAKFRAEYEQMKRRINVLLWDEKTGLYLNRVWDSDGGMFSYRKSAAHFTVLAAGIPDQRKADRIVKEHLLNPKEFWGEYVMPSISRDDPAFPEQYYWRGAIWPPMNYFTYEGLKRYGYDEVAAELVEKTYALVRSNWLSAGGVYEDYNSINGKGDPGGAQTTIHYSWSASLPMLAVMELIDVEAWGGLRFGSLGLKAKSGVKNVAIADAHYDVEAGPHTCLWKNGTLLFESDVPAVVRDFEQGSRQAGFRSNTAGRRSTIKLATPDASSVSALVVVDRGNPIELPVSNGRVQFSVPSGSHIVNVQFR
jgi:hypothetical protein